MGDIPIMEKYGISPGLYSTIFERLRSPQVLIEEDLAGRMQRAEAREQDLDKREHKRSYLLYAIPVCEAHDPNNKGLLIDISETGFQVAGMKVEEDEIGTFLIRSDALARHSVLAVDAICRWVHRDEHGNTVAGFEIASVLDRGEEELRKLIAELSVAEED
ncbi:MAG: PilZ domain-containing protein [Deltaproteobacteria bacterium]|nr:PilZ domain-containing protein [Deltaproteobacteria bacterium]